MDEDPCLTDPRDPCDKHGGCHCYCPCYPDGTDNCADCSAEFSRPFDRGGYMFPGLSTAWNNTGKPESIRLALTTD